MFNPIGPGEICLDLSFFTGKTFSRDIHPTHRVPPPLPRLITVRTGSWSTVTSVCWSVHTVFMLECFSLTESLETTALPCTKALMRSPHDEHPPKKPAKSTSPEQLVCVLNRVRLCDPMDYSPPGSSVNGILQARILEWVAKPSSRSQIHVSYVSCIGRGILYHCATWKPP